MPVYDEVGVLRILLNSVTDSLVACGTDYEIIFVNDGSSDATSMRSPPGMIASV